MAGSKADDRGDAPAPADAAGAGARVSGAIKKAVPPPLPPTGSRSSRSVRAATSVGGVGGEAPRAVEAPSLYSQVGRRSSPGMPAVSIAVDKLEKGGPAASPPSSARGGPPPIPDFAPLTPPDGPPTEKTARPPLSARPPAPEPFAAEQDGSESIAQTFDRLLGNEVDSRFGEMKLGSGRPPKMGELDDSGSLAEVRELFEQLASNHVRPVREFVIDLRWGEASREWIAICASAVDSLQRAAQKLTLSDLETALQEFGRALQLQAAQAADPADANAILEGGPRDGILVAYDRLVEILPKAFALDMDRAQRESLIVQSLLLAVPDVHRVTIERLHAAGLNGIAMLADARPRDIADAAGISAKLAERIVEAFRAYRDDRHAHLPDAMHARERAKVQALVTELESHHHAFELVAESWSREASAEKARLRRARHKTLMEINVVLARIGEIALLRTLEMVPFERKLDGLRGYLKEAETSFSL
jgi:hypothetical protein